MSINSKKKGNLWENKWANWLRDNGIKAWKDGASGGGTREKGDVGNGMNLHMEVKGVKKINLKKVWDKAVVECQKTHNEPLLAIHFDGMPEDRFLVVMDNFQWLELVKGEKEPPAEYASPQKKWDIQNLVNAAKKVIKHYEHS